MPLFVPVLRSVMLFMNIYESYKTLKPPPPSTRDPTRPSVRAATQRKRDLKGCLAVWIVWCCFTLYERIIESFVNLFIPFYDEFKSMVILFLILTRARGAEPIFLHILRPLIRPYDASIEGTLEVLRMTGDFIFALAAFPVQLAIKWWRNKFANLETSQGSDSDSSSEAATSQSVSPIDSADHVNGRSGIYATPLNTIKLPQKPSQGAIHRTSNGGAQSSPGQEKPTTSPQHQIWHPPRSAYEEETIQRTPSTGSDSNVSPPVIPLSQEEKQEVEEWRKYPAFPSAYPPTPLPTTLPLAAAAAVTTSAPFYPPIPEEGPLLQQDFHRSLKQPRKPLNPGYTHDLSDQNVKPVGIHRFDGFSGPGTATTSTVVETDDSMSDDLSYEEEDTFDKTLRTPLQPYGSLSLRNRTMLPPPLPISAFPSQSTAVDSVDTNSSLRTRTGSGSSSGSISSSVPLSGASSSPMDIEMDDRIMSETIKPDSKPRRDTITRGRPAALPQRRPLKTRTSPIKKRKVFRAPTPADSTTASGTTDDDSREISSASQPESSKDAYVPGEQQKAPVSKRIRVTKATISTSDSGASRTVLFPRVGANSSGNAAARTVRPRSVRASSPAVAPIRRSQAKARQAQSAGTRLGQSVRPISQDMSRKLSRTAGLDGKGHVEATSSSRLLGARSDQNAANVTEDSKKAGRSTLNRDTASSSTSSLSSSSAPVNLLPEGSAEDAIPVSNPESA